MGILSDFIQTSTVAGRATAGSAGRLHFPSNGMAVARDSGAAWAPWGPIWPLTPVVDGDFSWVNQASCSIVTTNGVVALVGSPAGNVTTLSCRVKTAPSTPYTITAFVQPMMLMKEYQSYGLCFRNSGTGAIAALSVLAVDAGLTTPSIISGKYTNATTFSADYTARKVPQMVQWLRIADNGTNRIVSFSGDGYNWIELHSVGRTDFVTADQVGFFVGCQNLATTNFAPILSVLSWVQG